MSLFMVGGVRLGGGEVVELNEERRQKLGRQKSKSCHQALHVKAITDFDLLQV